MKLARLTWQRVSEILQENWEGTKEADLVVQWCRKYEGKPIRKDRLPEGARLCAPCSTMLQLQFGPYGKTKSFLIGWKTVYATVPSEDFVIKENPCYFKAAHDRDMKRMELRNDKEALEQVAERYNRLAIALELVDSEMSYLLHNQVDDYYLKAAIGIDTVKINLVQDNGGKS